MPSPLLSLHRSGQKKGRNNINKTQANRKQVFFLFFLYFKVTTLTAPLKPNTKTPLHYFLDLALPCSLHGVIKLPEQDWITQFKHFLNLTQ